MGHLYTYAKTVQSRSIEGKTETSPIPDPGIETVGEALSRESALSLSEGRCREILAPLELPFGASSLCQSIDAAQATAKEMGYPVVLKMDSPQILHKTECRGVHLNIKADDDLSCAFDDMMGCWKAMEPPVPLDGIMVQKMISGGIELIIGVTRDPLFGPALMLGWGGVFVEALGLAAWRVCPIGEQDALQMIREVAGLVKVLGGVRGRPPLDRRALVELMMRISSIACALKDRISSMDFNPIVVQPEGQGAKVLDCRMVLRADGSVS